MIRTNRLANFAEMLIGLEVTISCTCLCVPETDRRRNETKEQQRSAVLGSRIDSSFETPRLTISEIVALDSI
jgi:hypothetical protein